MPTPHLHVGYSNTFELGIGVGVVWLQDALAVYTTTLDANLAPTRDTIKGVTTALVLASLSQGMLPLLQRFQLKTRGHGARPPYPVAFPVPPEKCLPTCLVVKFRWRDHKF